MEKYMLHTNSLKIDKHKFTYSEVPPKNNVIAKADSGASSHYFREHDIRCLRNLKPYKGHTVTLPLSETITSSQQGVLSL